MGPVLEKACILRHYALKLTVPTKVSYQKKALWWIRTVENLGLREVRKRPGYHDEPLKGSRRGQRSIRLNRGYRLIYCELQKEIHIELIEVHKHEY